jgi:hypothetical protein
MENLDVIILTMAVALAFVIFIITSLKEIRQMADEPYKFEKPSGFTRGALFDALSSLFDDDEISIEKRKRFKANLERIISDKETDDIYFPKTKETIKKENSEDKTDSLRKN